MRFLKLFGMVKGKRATGSTATADEASVMIEKTPKATSTGSEPTEESTKTTIMMKTLEHKKASKKVAQALAESGSGAGKAKVARKSKHESRRAARRKHRKNMKRKEPAEALSYLKAWEKREGASGTWKFNKATQEWILRHAYDAELVPKETFRLMLLYLEGLKGAGRQRACDRAAAIQALGGAPLADPEEQQESQRAKKQRLKQEAKLKRKEEALMAAKAAKAAKRNKNAGDEDDEMAEPAPSPEAPVDPPVDPAKAREEEKARKMRLRRCRKILKALGDPRGEEGMEDLAGAEAS